MPYNTVNTDDRRDILIGLHTGELFRSQNRNSKFVKIILFEQGYLSSR